MIICQNCDALFREDDVQTSLPENMNYLSTSIYDLVLIYVCHFHHHFLRQLPLLKSDHYRDTRASTLDPRIQGIFSKEISNLGLA